MAANAPFVVFGPSHLTVLALIVIVPAVLIGLVKFTRSAILSRVICWTMALTILLTWVAWFNYFDKMGWLALGNVLPMDLCTWAALAVIVTLVKPNQYSYELAYFWGMAGTVQGMITPDIGYDFPHFLFIEFSLFHGVIIAAVLFLTFAVGLRPYAKSIPRVIGWSFFYMGFAGLIDWLLNVNYGFLRAKPSHPSPYDLMPDWPYYLGVVVVLALVSVVVWYLPFFAYDKIKALRAKKAA